MIDVAGLGKTVQTGREPLTILHDIAFAVPKGDSLAIVGASGSGKSTLLALLAGLDRPSAGSVHLAGRDLARLDEDDCARLRAELAGFVFQSFQLLPEFTALENVMLPLEIAATPPLGRRVAEQLAREWLGKVGLADRLQHRPRELSGGEQQRVALARAFAPSPAILFADEPTGSLDAATGERVADMLFDLQREAGTTLVLVTHEDRLARRCDWRLHLQAGQIASFDRVAS